MVTKNYVTAAPTVAILLYNPGFHASSNALTLNEFYGVVWLTASGMVFVALLVVDIDPLEMSVHSIIYQLY